MLIVVYDVNVLLIVRTFLPIHDYKPSVMSGTQFMVQLLYGQHMAGVVYFLILKRVSNFLKILCFM